MSIEKLKLELKGLSQTRDPEKYLEVCNQILEIDNNHVPTIESKLWTLSHLNRADEAYEFYKSLDDGITIHEYYMHTLAASLVQDQRYDDALDLTKEMLMENPWDVSAIDLIKRISKFHDINPTEYFDKCLYISWISLIKSKKDLDNLDICPICKSKMIPIVYGYPSIEMMEMADKGEIILGGCVIDGSNKNFYCRKCDREMAIDTGIYNLEVDDESNPIEYNYLCAKLGEITNYLECWENLPLDELRSDMDYFDDDEFNAFINKLKEVEYIHEDKKGYLKLVDDETCY